MNFFVKMETVLPAQIHTCRL